MRNARGTAIMYASYVRCSEVLTKPNNSSTDLIRDINDLEYVINHAHRLALTAAVKQASATPAGHASTAHA